MAHLDGALVRALVARRGALFVALLVRWMVVAVPSSLCNALIKYLGEPLWKAPPISTTISFLFRE